MTDCEVAAALETFPCLLRGFDSLYISYYLDLASCDIDFDDLEFRKQEAKADRGRDFAEVELGSERFALLLGGRGKYRFVLANDFFEVRLSEGMQPSCYVQFFSKALWQLGLDALCRRLDRWFASLAIVKQRPEVIGRSDWAFDFHVDAPDFTIDHFVSRAAKDAMYREHGKEQTFNFGRGHVVVRVYDKCAEIEQESGKSWFYELWGQRESVWRIEFQVRGERLKTAGIRSIDELRDLQNDLLRELASRHTTLRKPNGDGNRSRWPLHPLWRQLQAEIASLPQTGLVQAIDPKGTLRWRQEQQLRAIYGSLKGFGAVVQLLSGREDTIPLPELLKRLQKLLERDHCPQLWREDIQRRVTAHGLGRW